MLDFVTHTHMNCLSYVPIKSAVFMSDFLCLLSI